MKEIILKKNEMRWLFGGIGFHDSEATMLGIMNDDFKNQKVLKTFREISPTYSRVFTGYADWTKEAMDEFADFYDLTFRKANTTLYLVPGRLPYRTSDFDMDEYAEKVATNLDYLIKERKCTKIRHYCLTNELACGNGRPLVYYLDEFKAMQEALYRAFRRHGLKIGLLSMDSAGMGDPWHYHDWALANMDEITECYCHHFYPAHYEPGTPRLYNDLYWRLDLMVQRSLAKEKRFVLGEFGIKKTVPSKAMRSDRASYVDFPDLEPTAAIQLAEIAICAINTGCFSAACWTLFDYPDPFIAEDGDTEEEKKRFNVANYSGHGISTRYNKNGMVRWSDEENDYRAYASLYTMGYMAKLFRKGSRVLSPEFDDDMLRVAAVTNPDGTCSVVIINWKDTPETVMLKSEHKSDKPFRKYEYCADNPPYNDFNDLQDFVGLVSEENGSYVVELPACSVVFLTTDYQERIPSEIKNLKVEDGCLMWDACPDEEHCYYRIYQNGKQIASTVAEYLAVSDIEAGYEVYSVDKYGNCAR